MAVTSFVTPTAATVEQEVWFPINTINADQVFPSSYNAGLYRIRAYAVGLNSTPTVTYKVYAADDSLSSTVTSVDIDTGSSANYSEAIISITGNGATIVANTNTLGYLAIQKVGTAAAITAIPTTTYQTSQSITLTKPITKVALFGGGGGAKNSGGGGGSGYLTKFTLAPGTYTLVAGAGGAGGNNGAGGSNGGQSSFAGYTANGGNGAINNDGGAGGSGGAGYNYYSGTVPQGGTNGANGQTIGAPGGAGSGVTLPWYIPNANGVYRGGNGCFASGGNVSGSNGTGIAGAGNAGNDYYSPQATGSGAAGGIIIF